jgi:hypothetical protein
MIKPGETAERTAQRDIMPGPRIEGMTERGTWNLEVSGFLLGATARLLNLIV